MHLEDIIQEKNEFHKINVRVLIRWVVAGDSQPAPSRFPLRRFLDEAGKTLKLKLIGK